MNRSDTLENDLSEAVADALPAFRNVPCEHIAGSGTARSYALTGKTGERLFLKTLPASQSARHDAEVTGLNTLASCKALRVPRVIHQGQTDKTSWLALEWLDLQPLSGESAARMGEALAALHAISGEQYGFSEDNYLGPTLQCNTPHPHWGQFFARQRIAPLLMQAVGRGYVRLSKPGHTLIEKLPALFVGHQPPPSLIHGDLWGGNCAALPDGTPVFIGPACHYADREVDIATGELFGNLPTRALAAYRAAWPLDANYEVRKVAYNLYPILNHLNLYGMSYLGQAERMIHRLLAEL